MPLIKNSLEFKMNTDIFLFEKKYYDPVDDDKFWDDLMLDMKSISGQYGKKAMVRLLEILDEIEDMNKLNKCKITKEEFIEKHGDLRFRG